MQKISNLYFELKQHFKIEKIEKKNKKEQTFWFLNIMFNIKIYLSHPNICNSTVIKIILPGNS